MAYRRSNYPRRRRPYRRPAYKKNAYAVANKALAMAKKNNYKEIKYNNVTLPSTVSSTASITELSVVGQGDSTQARDGNVVKGTSINVRGTLAINASATCTQVRMIIFQYKTEAPSTALDILEASSIQSFKSRTDRYKSVFLYDRVFQLDSVNKPEIFFNIKRKLKNQMVTYDDSNTDATGNSVSVLLISNEATNVPDLTAKARFIFQEW